MGSLDRAAAQRNRRRIDLIDAQQCQPGDKPHHVDDRVDGANLVKVHLLQGNTVYFGLGASQPLDHGHTALLDRVSQRAALDDLANVVQVARRIGLQRIVHVQLGAGQAVIALVYSLQLIAIQVHLLQFSLQRVEFQSHVQQRAKEHVAAHPGKAVQVHDAQRSFPLCVSMRAARLPGVQVLGGRRLVRMGVCMSLVFPVMGMCMPLVFLVMVVSARHAEPFLATAARLAINPAIAPAPIPLPIFTTAMPGAQVCNIEYSAATPSPPSP